MAATSDRSQRRSTVALVLACISLALSAAAAIGAVAAADDGAGSSDRLPVDGLPVDGSPVVAGAAQVEAVAHVTLPPGTVLLSAAYRNGLETRLNAKFRMPRGELDAFVEDAAFTATLQPGLRAVGPQDNVGGGNLWDPGSAKSVQGLREQEPAADGTRRAVLVGLDAPDAVTVYLVAGRN